MKDEVKRVKERVNAGFEVLLRLHEETINRDSVIVESLLDTQLGKLRRLIVKKDTHEDLKMFADELNENFEWPDIQLSLKPPAAWRAMDSAPMSQATRASSGGRRKMNSTLQAHTRLTSIGRRPGTGHRAQHSGSRSSHSRTSSRHKRPRRGSGKRRQGDRPYQTATEEDDPQNNSEALIHEVELTEGVEGVEHETTMEVDTGEDEPRKRQARRSDHYRQRAKRNPRVGAYAKNVEAYGGEHGSKRSSFRRRNRSSSSRTGQDGRLVTGSSHRSVRSTSERGRSSRSERGSRSRSDHGRRGSKGLSRGAQPPGDRHSNHDLPGATRNEKFHSFGY